MKELPRCWYGHMDIQRAEVHSESSIRTATRLGRSEIASISGEGLVLTQHQYRFSDVLGPNRPGSLPTWCHWLTRQRSSFGRRIYLSPAGQAFVNRPSKSGGRYAEDFSDFVVQTSAGGSKPMASPRLVRRS